MSRKTPTATESPALSTDQRAPSAKRHRARRGEKRLAEFLLTAATEHGMDLPPGESHAQARAILDYWDAVQPAELVLELYVGYDFQHRTCNLLAVLSGDWRPFRPGLPLETTPEEQRHRILFYAKRDIWRRYPTLLFDVYPAPPHRFPGFSIRDIFDRLVPADTVYLGLVPLSPSVAPQA